MTNPIPVWCVPPGARKIIQAAGLRFRLHEARRTFITERLLNGAPLADVQAGAGHAQASTMLVYAQAADAIERQARVDEAARRARL